MYSCVHNSREDEDMEAYDDRDHWTPPADLRSTLHEQLPGGIDPRPIDRLSGSQPFDDR